MATMTVKNASGGDETVEKPNANGRAAAAASRPVALSTEDKTALDAVATSAKQDTILSRIGEVQATPTSNTLLDRVKALLTGIVLAAGGNIIGKVGVDQTTDGTTNKVNIDASLKSGTPTRSSVNSGTSSVTILASNANRKGATILNSDANALLLDLSGGTAASTRYQVRLAQYQSYEVGSGYTGAITGIWEADGAGVADVVEFT